MRLHFKQRSDFGSEGSAYPPAMPYAPAAEFVDVFLVDLMSSRADRGGRRGLCAKFQGGVAAAGHAQADKAAGQADLHDRHDRRPVSSFPLSAMAILCSMKALKREAFACGCLCRIPNLTVGRRMPVNQMSDCQAERTVTVTSHPCRLNAYWLGWSPSTFYRVYSIEVSTQACSTSI